MMVDRFIIEILFEVDKGNFLREYVYEVDDKGEVYLCADFAKAKQYREDELDSILDYLNVVVPDKFQSLVERIEISCLGVNF